MATSPMQRTHALIMRSGRLRGMVKVRVSVRVRVFMSVCAEARYQGLWNRRKTAAPGYG